MLGKDSCHRRFRCPQQLCDRPLGDLLLGQFQDPLGLHFGLGPRWSTRVVHKWSTDRSTHWSSMWSALPREWSGKRARLVHVLWSTVFLDQPGQGALPALGRRADRGSDGQLDSRLRGEEQADRHMGCQEGPEDDGAGDWRGNPPGASTWAAFAATETAVKNPTAHQESSVDPPRAP